MNQLSVFSDALCGWAMWSLSHNVGHRWWHIEMRLGTKTPYAHGEREHHRVYDQHGAFAWQHEEDPKELFISFPLIAVAPVGLLFVAGYGWLRGWEHCAPFAIAMYSCMVLDHRLHIMFHSSPPLPGILGRLQRMHKIHHQTHTYNYFFCTGLVWDVLLRTARFRGASTAVHPDAPELLTP